jgi:hypothetical protein
MTERGRSARKGVSRITRDVPKCNLGTRFKATENIERFDDEDIYRRLIVDSVRSREPSPCGIAFGDSILPVPNGQDWTSSG